MSTNYDSIAEQYKRAKLQPWRANIEAFTLMGLLGDVTGKSVVDLACGEGFYTRLVRQKGASRALGVDLSHRMVELGRKQETEHPLGIEYLVGDALALNLGEEFDIVVAAYLLNYARNREELGAMCRSIGRSLKQGGRFVTVNSSPSLDFQSAPSFRKYGFETTIAGEQREGTPIAWTFFLDDGPLSIENYFLDVAVHVEAFRASGFREIRWHQPRLSPQGIDANGQEYWKDFMDHSPVTFIECVK